MKRLYLFLVLSFLWPINLYSSTPLSNVNLSTEDKILAAPGMTIYFYFTKSSKIDQKKKINFHKL